VSIMKIALIKGPATYADWYRRPVLGLAYLCSYLKANGVECRIFDAYYNSWPEKDLCDRVVAYNPDLVGFTAMTHEIVTAAQIASRLKSMIHVPAVIGGCHITALPGRTLVEFPVFDYGIRGEAEASLLDLARCLANGNREAVGKIAGIVFRSGPDIVTSECGTPPSSAELDAYPMPAFDDYYGERRDALGAPHAEYVLIASRGCPYRCAFCMRVLGTKVRRRSPESVCDEMEYAMQRYGAHTFDFCDDILLYDNPVTRRLLGLMISRGFPAKSRWRGVTRVDLVSKDIARMARESGCFRLGIGIESGDDRILAAIGKDTTAEQAKEAVSILKAAGMAVDTYFIVGHPNETEESLRRTLDLAVELNGHVTAVGVMVPYPGTRIHEMAARGEAGYRLLTEDWTQYDKYGGRALELKGLPYEDLVKWQRRILINVYVRNHRFMDLARYIWERRRALSFFAKRKLGLAKAGVRA
jgi:anaerobic magnesium-protoporphyrin IX monomethyl ester cyclase